MQTSIRSRLARQTSKRLVVLVALGLHLLLGSASARAQESNPVQELEGSLQPGEAIFYRLPELRAGQTLYARMEGRSGNLDPILGLVGQEVDPEQLEREFENALAQAAAGGEDPLVAIEEIRDQFALAWDDDGGGGLSAALEYEIPADGDYLLLVSGALSTLGGATFGDYALMVGLDAQGVLTGETESTGDTLAVRDVEATPPGIGVQEITGSFTPEKRSTFVELQAFEPGDTLFATIEATSGDLAPGLVLRNFANKPVRSVNLDGQKTDGNLQFTFPEGGAITAWKW